MIVGTYLGKFDWRLNGLVSKADWAKFGKKELLEGGAKRRPLHSFRLRVLRAKTRLVTPVQGFGYLEPRCLPSQLSREYV